MFRKKLHLPSNLCKNKLIQYSLAFLITYLISHHLLDFFGFHETNIESARYLLSTLIESEATVLALVVTVSLIVVQLTIPYFPKINKIFRSIKKNPDFYLVFFSYFGIIFYGCWVLKQLRIEENSSTIQNFGTYWFFSSIEDHIKTVFILALISFSFLLVYIRNTIELLNPFNIIKILREDITKENTYASLNVNNPRLLSKAREEINNLCGLDLVENILDTREAFSKYDNIVPFELIYKASIDKEKDPFEPLFEMAFCSLNNENSFEIAEECIKTIRCKIEEIFGQELFTPNKNPQNELNNGNLSIEKLDEDSREDRHCLRDCIFNKIFNEESNHLNTYSIDEINSGIFLLSINSRLYIIGKLAADKKAEGCVVQVITSIYQTGFFISNILTNFKEIKESIEFMKDIAIISLKKGDTSAAYRTQKLLQVFAIFGIYSNKKRLTEEILSSLNNIHRHEKKAPQLANDIEEFMNVIYDKISECRKDWRDDFKKYMLN